MAIQSWGYPSTISPGPVWANLQLGLGRRYMVAAQTDLAVTAVAGGTRQISISGGYASGWGVLDFFDAPYVLALPVVTSGTKWFMVVLRRTHGTTNATTVVAIDAGTSGALLPTRNTNRGVLDDQPIAMVPLTAGDTVPGTPIDLRVMGADTGEIAAKSDLVLQYMQGIGVRIRINGILWTRVANPSGGSGQVWLKEAPPSLANGSSVFVPQAGWNNVFSEAVLDRYQVQIDLDVRRYSARIWSDADGTLPEVWFGNVPDPYRPVSRELAFAFKYFGGSGATTFSAARGLGTLKINGDLFINQLSGGIPLNQRVAADTQPSIRAHITFIRRTLA